MNDRKYRDQKARVKKLVSKWYDAMGMGWFHIDFYYERERSEDNPKTLAITQTDWQYRKASITFFMPNVENNDEDYLETAIVHEFVHILISPLCVVNKSEDLPLQHEYATECLARAMRWVRKAGAEDAKV